MMEELLLKSLLGPFNFFRRSMLSGVIALMLPCVCTCLLVFTSGGSWLLDHYKAAIFSWCSFYWLFCILLCLIIEEEEKEKKTSALPDNQQASLRRL